VVSGQELPDVVTMHADATIYVADLDAGRTIEFNTDQSRCIFVYLTAGDMEINGERLRSNDQARITGESSLRLKAHDTTSLVLIDAPAKDNGTARKL
jgi:redox-sensitive bicupin YhaK (pirin superfamily)